MKILIVASAKGGSAKSTTVVRLAESLHGRGISTAILDLSPFPTANWLLREPAIPVVQGRSATTLTAARSTLKPYEAKTELVLIDTGRLEDKAIEPWLPLCHSILITTECSPFAIASMPTIWEAVSNARRINPELAFTGLLAINARPRDVQLVSNLPSNLRRYFLPTIVPHDTTESRRSQQGLILGLHEVPAPPAAEDSLVAYAGVADHLANSLELKVAEPIVEKKETGLLGRLWKLASKAMGPKVQVVQKGSLA